MNGYLRYALAAIGVLTGILAIGFAFQLGWATSLWPWPDSRLTYIFVGSIAAAIAAPVLWIALSGELGAVPGGALNIGAIGSGSTIYLLTLAARRDDARLLVTGLMLALVVVASAGLFVATRRTPLRDERPMPTPVRLSFVGFALALIAVAIALLARASHIFPWPLRADTSVLIGWTFLGAALYFLYPLRRPSWSDATGQLLGFLAYDLVLIGPFLRHLGHVQPAHRLSLLVYLAVLIYSGGLAIYYLLIQPSTRLWGQPVGRPALE